MTGRRRNALLLAAAAIVAAPLLLPVAQQADRPFAGTDSQATDAVAAAHPEYEPWFAPFWTPPGPEVESLLFAIQAAIGAGLVGYYLGLRRGETRGRRAPPAELEARTGTTDAGD